MAKLKRIEYEVEDGDDQEVSDDAVVGCVLIDRLTISSLP